MTAITNRLNTRHPKNGFPVLEISKIYYTIESRRNQSAFFLYPFFDPGERISLWLTQRTKLSNYGLKKRLLFMSAYLPGTRLTRTVFPFNEKN